MSGAWAREADAIVCLGTWNLADAALWLADALNCDGAGRAIDLMTASAIIRRERKRLDLKKEWPRQDDWDWAGNIPDEALIWYALRAVAQAANLSASSGTWHLREAEAALRTLHKRGRS